MLGQLHNVPLRSTAYEQGLTCVLHSVVWHVQTRVAAQQRRTNHVLCSGGHDIGVGTRAHVIAHVRGEVLAVLVLTQLGGSYALAVSFPERELGLLHVAEAEQLLELAGVLLT